MVVVVEGTKEVGMAQVTSVVLGWDLLACLQLVPSSGGCGGDNGNVGTVVVEFEAGGKKSVYDQLFS